MREINVDGEIPSADRGQAVADRFAELAEREGASPDQIAAEAISLYVRLPSHARQAWRSMEAEDDVAVLDEAAWAAGRALINRRMDAILDAVRLRGDSPLPADASEQDILDYAVEITRRR
jgi:hypothetical protein